ncbi:hypothetical protein BKA66DRAFT_566287 [Pyrenochaeta sp. MPI-SDFR-AT-0127]|nr:hypothetical protein BKA66DRAFT_566287 [Pyrenochaeta sp. MPI-SDFR-AT-0127]
MARFAFQLKAVNCTQDMWVQFHHNKTFQDAKKNWDWVNFNGMRSFVVVADHFKCGRDWSLDPWLASNVRFDQETLKVHLDVEKRTWKNVTRSYSLDFGEVQRGRNKRQISLDRAFTLDLSSNWPSKIINEKWTHKSGSVTFGVSCVECGTDGTLVFAGHIEGNPFTGIDKLLVSATPNGIRADLNLEVAFSGNYNFKGKDFAKRDFTLIQIPLPYGIRIPGVFTFGPHADVIAGYELKSIEGEATIGTGVSAVIPDDSIAKVDVFGNKKVDVRGWIPTFETKPLTIEAQISASGTLYTKLAVAASIEVFDETGITIDVNLQFPKISVEAVAGYNADGFCPNKPDPFGVSLDVFLGAEVSLEAWGEVDGKRKTFFDVDLFVDDDLHHFPVVCLSFGGGTPGSCTIDLEPEDQLWYEVEVANGISNSLVSRELPDFAPRASDMELLADDRKYALDCDEKSSPKWPIELKDYYVPTAIVNLGHAPTPVPVMKSLLGCSNDKISECNAERWKIEEGDASDVTASYNAEHIYEGFWMKEFLDRVKTDVYGSQQCENYATGILKLGDTTGWADKLVSQLGNIHTYEDTMTLLNGRENRVKHRMFNKGVENIYVYDSSSLTLANRVCRLGRIVAACKYMEMPQTKSYLDNTIADIVRVLFDMDGELFSGNDVLRNVHRTWFPEMYNAGIKKTKEYLVKMAEYIEEKTDDDDFKRLPEDVKEAILELKTGEAAKVEKYCNATIDYRW